MDRAPHPWNRDFAWSDHTGPLGFVTAQQAAEFDELGYFVIEDAFDEFDVDERHSFSFQVAAPGLSRRVAGMSHRGSEITSSRTEPTQYRI